MYQIFIQARLGSTRLPKKIFKKIKNKTILELIIERLNQIKGIDEIFLITGSYEKNRDLINLVEKYNIRYFSGNEENILDRFYQASLKFKSENIIRITGDCPLIDYELISKSIKLFEKSKPDILSNIRERTFPHGFDFEIFTQKALEKSWKIKKKELGIKFHNTFISPTIEMLERNQFINYDITQPINYSKFRLTLDYEEDYKLIKKIFNELYDNSPLFNFQDILNLVTRKPELMLINKKYSI